MTTPTDGQLTLVDHEPHVSEYLPGHAKGWWCWRCGWWRLDTGQHSYVPQECPECSTWSRERHLPLDTIRPVYATLELR